MFCPTCGQQQAAENVRFCSRCGFLLTGVTEIVANNGLIQPNSVQIEEIQQDSARKRGLKQGLMILLVGMLLIVPLITMIHIMTDSEPYAAAIATIICFFGGILRMVYALMFESKQTVGKTLEQKVFEKAQKVLGNKKIHSLPPEQSIPASDYIAPAGGSWRTTNDLVQPSSVTDNTTKLLEKEEG